MTIECNFSISHQDFNLQFKQTLSNNGITAIYGPSGSGKTTLLQLMAGLKEVDNSTFIVNKQVFQDAKTFVPPERRNIGYVGQSTLLFPFLTVKQNINFAQKRAYKSQYASPEIHEIIEAFGIGHCLNKKTAQLSSGETQRIKIIQSLVNQPSLFLFDEVLSAVDNQRKDFILAYLKNYFNTRKIPMIFVSHNPSEINLIADTATSII